MLGVFIGRLTNNRNQNNILKKILESEETWKIALKSEEAKDAISRLVNTRIKRLSKISKKKPTWAFLVAFVNGHPEVQDFLRSELDCVKYANFNDLNHACDKASNFGFSLLQIAEGRAISNG